MKKISILIPAYNEEKNIEPLLTQLELVIKEHLQYKWEVLFVNDGSRDNTLSVLQVVYDKYEYVHYVDLSRNFGKEIAMLAGFDYVTGDCVIIMDADLQHPPHIIPNMIKWWENGYEDVYAKRTDRGQESFLRKQLSLFYYRLLQKTTKIEILQNVGDFRLLDRSCINSLCKLRESQRYTKGLYCWIGFKKKEIEFEQKDRLEGVSSFNFLSLISLAIEGITSYTVLPLRISTVFGIIISVLSFLYIIYLVIKTLIFGDPVQGYPSLMVTILFIGGVQMIALGIIGEYLGRIFYETKNRPTYIAREYNGNKIY